MDADRELFHRLAADRVTMGWERNWFSTSAQLSPAAFVSLPRR